MSSSNERKMSASEQGDTDCNNTQTQELAKENNFQNIDQLNTLPRTVLDQILMHLARIDYDSLLTLTRTSRAMQSKCQDFIKRHPRSLFRRPGGMSDSDDSDGGWIGDDDDDRSSYVYHEPDDIDDYFDRLSFGSNYDEELYEVYLAQGSGDLPEGVVNVAEPAGDAGGVDWDEEW